MTQLRYALGKKPATEDRRDLKLTRYLTQLPPIPTGVIGHTSLMGSTSWGMFANDRYGDCVWAGAAHETMLWNLEGHRVVPFNDDAVLADYADATGFDPSDPRSDQGTDMRQAMLYRQKTGVIDSTGLRHQIGAFVAIQSIDELKRTIYLFGAACVGIRFPASAMEQFDSDMPWDISVSEDIQGGHYIPVVGYDSDSDLFQCVTWGRLQPVTPAFFARYMDEAYAAISKERLSNGQSLEGFDFGQLQYDLAHIGEPVDSEPDVSMPDDVDQALWATVRDWGFAPHTRTNKTAANAVVLWARAKGLE